MKRVIFTIALMALLAGQQCQLNLPEDLIPGDQSDGGTQAGTTNGINAVPPSGSAIPEIGAPVSVRIINLSGREANVTVRYLVGPVEVRLTQLLVPPLTTMADIGPDLAAVVEISGQFVAGGATPSVVSTLGQTFESGDRIDYIISDPNDTCPSDPNKATAGQCGCGVPDTDADGDGTADCIDNCPNDSGKVNPGICGCGVAETDGDGDASPDCVDQCPNDPAKIAPGVCGCGQAEDANQNGTPDCQETSPPRPPVTDCNQNGVADSLDISRGTSYDCDENGIPDECDIAAGTSQDCNENNVPDPCDIASGTSEDCNENGRPDECDIALGWRYGGPPLGESEALPGSVMPGPVLIGGLDADDHGSFSDGANQLGWRYLQEGVELVGSQVQNGNNLAVCLGCNAGQALAAFQSAVGHSDLPAHGWTTAILTGQAAIEAFFANTGTVKIADAGMIYLPTDGLNVAGGISSLEMDAINAHAVDISVFLASGGGLFALDETSVPNGWGWLQTLWTGLTPHDATDVETHNLCDDGHATLTPLGAAVLPGVTGDDIAGGDNRQWHTYFLGSLGDLSAIAIGSCDSGERPIILGRVQAQQLITLAPASAQNPVGTPHMVTATVKDEQGNPLNGVKVTFTVIDGPNAGITATMATWYSGLAFFSYRGSSVEGTDHIVASFSDEGGVHTSNVATKVWLGSTDCNENGIPDECEGGEVYCYDSPGNY